ncbi:MAG TPA: DUF2905 domain-containing protein [Fimbriimonadales bacterium]|nr:DUF2905 domain-containing protein [Fimbriimonadales bacterium]
MDELAVFAKFMIFIGLSLAGFGLLLWLASKGSGFRIGRLPGDILIQKDGFTFYFPIVTMILLSIVLTLVLWFIAWLRRG